MQVKQVVEIIITDMKAGKITGLILDNEKFIGNTKSDPKTIEIKELPVKLPPKLKRIPKRSKNKVDTWIKEKNITKFSMKEYLQDRPNDYYQRKRIEHYITKMVKDKTLTQISNDSFIVNKKN